MERRGAYALRRFFVWLRPDGGLRRSGARKAENVAEGKGLGRAGRSSFFEDLQQVPADGERGTQLCWLVIIGAGEDEDAAAAYERVVAGDPGNEGGFAVGRFGVGRSRGVEGGGVGFFDDFGGAVVIDVVPGERGAGLDGQPSGELHAFGRGGGLGVVAVFEDADPVADESFAQVRLD